MTIVEHLSMSELLLLNWESVSSSNIEMVASREDFLYVRFRSSAIYRYQTPPPAFSVKAWLIAAGDDPDGSAGKWFNDNIKNLPYVRVHINEEEQV